MAKNNKGLKHVRINNPTVIEAEHYIRMVGLGDLLGLTIIGPPGMGKTHLIEHTLEELDVEYVKYGGHITLAAIYEFLCQNADKLIFFDDCSALVNNTEILELLKQALSESHVQRIVSYRSFGVKVNAPKEFAFDGRIIMTFNKMDMNPNVAAVISRAPLVELRYAFSEILDAMKEISKGDSGGLLEHEKIIVTNEIAKYVDPSMEISLRDQQQAFRIFAYAKRVYGDPPSIDNWRPLIQRIFKKKKESWIKEMVKDAVGEAGKIKRKDLVTLIAVKRDMSPRNAQRRVAEWLEAGEIYTNKERDGDISIKPFKDLFY